jgi:hypothetical protein
MECMTEYISCRRYIRIYITQLISRDGQWEAEICMYTMCNMKTHTHTHAHTHTHTHTRTRTHAMLNLKEMAPHAA